MRKAFLFLMGALIIYFSWRMIFNIQSGCNKYSSRFDCEHIETKANYEVWYWRNVMKGDGRDNEMIGMAKGLLECRDTATRYGRLIHDQWTERSYICALVKDGQRLEKHRLIK